MAEYDLGTARGKIEIDSSQVEQGVGRATQATSDFDRSQQVAAQNLVRSGTLMVGASAAIAGGFAVAVNASADFESSMQQIVGLVGVSQEQVDAWKGDLLDMAGALGKSPKELADALFFITSAGLQGKEAMDALNISARASAAGLGETKTIADAVTSAINAYGKENMTAAGAADILTQTVKEGKVEASELAPVLGRILPTASELGVKFEDVGAAIASMTREGLNADQASTRVGAIMRSLIKPGADAEAALSAVGMSMGDVRKEVQEKGLFSALMHMKDAVHGNQQELARIFPDSEAFGGVLSITGKNAEANKGIFDDMAHSTGALDKAFNSASQTANFKFQQAMQSLQALLIQVGAILAPMAADFAQMVAHILQAIGGLDPGILRIVVTIGKFAAVLLGTVGAFMIVIGWVKKLQLAFGAMNAFLAANPFTVIILALVALGVAFYAAYQNIQPFHDWVDKTAATIRENLLPIIEQFKLGLQAFWAAFQEGDVTSDGFVGFMERAGVAARQISDWINNVAIPALQDFWDNVNTVVDALGGWQTVLIAVGVALALLLAPIPSIIAAVIYAYNNFDIFRTVVDNLIQAFSDAYSWINDNLYPVFFSLGELLAAVAQRVITAWETMWPFISVALSLIMDGVSIFVGNVETLWDAFGADILNAIMIVFDNIRGTVEAVMTVIQGIIDTVTALIKGDWSGVWTGIQEIFQGVWDAIKQYVETSIAAVQLVIQTITDAIKAAWQITWDTIKGTIQAAWDAIKLLVSAAIGFVKDTITDKVNALKDLWSTVWDAIKDKVTGVWNAIKDFVTGKITEVHDFVSDRVTDVQNLWAAAWDAVSQKVSDIMESIKSTVRGALDTVVGWIQGLGDVIRGAAAGAFDGLKDAAKSAVNGIIGLFNGMIDVVNGVQFHIHIHDPVPGLPNIDFDWGGVGLPHIPYLDTGALVSNPTLAALAMNSVPEIVTPIPMLESMFEKYAQPATIDLTFSFTGVSADDIPAIKKAVTGDDVINVLIGAAKAGRRG